ncbi:helix-turn-helix domain-containing protein [Candidatus Methylobacter favarea]|uniref:helix-turn-helix domain-containing protein n=1 Tax=Candidatus Methylobacter favarea TaxID=2707345 RepID=UPI003CCE50F4
MDPPGAWSCDYLPFNYSGPITSTFGEFERVLIKERQREGIALAKQRGAYRGRKQALSTEQQTELLKRVTDGEPKTPLAREFGISSEMLYHT